MIAWWWLLVTGSLGLVFGGLLLWLWGRSNQSALTERVTISERELQKASVLQQENEQIKIQIVELKKEREADEEKLQFVTSAEESIREAFQALASQSLQTNADEFIKRAREQVDGMLEQVQGRLEDSESRTAIPG